MQRKIKVVMQHGENDCGPACLLSIIKYYDGNVSLEKIKSDCNTTLEGTTAYDLLMTSKLYGFDSVGYKLDKNMIFEENRIFPMICHVKYNNLLHYVVLYQINSRRAIIMDPAVGRKVLSINDFFESWTGNIIELYPRKEITILKQNNTLIEMFINIINKEKKIITRLFISNLLLVIVTILSSYYFKTILDNINSDISLLKYICYIFFIIAIIKCLINSIRKKYNLILNKNLDVYLFKDFIEHLFKIPSKTMQTKTMGEIITRINDLGGVKSLFSDLIISFFLDLILTLVAIPILLVIDYKLFIILLFVIILYLILGLLFSKIIHKKILNNKEKENKFNTEIYESVLMINNLKNLNKTNAILLKLEKTVSNYLYDNYIIESINSFQYNIKYFIDEMTTYLIYTVGLYNIINNNMQISNLILFITLMNFFLNPIKNFTNNIPKYNYIKASVHKLNEFMNIKEEEEKMKQKIYKWDIEIKKLNFSYNNFKQILKSINLTIKSNEHVLISGKSGGGKSTLCKLLTKNEDKYEGEIFFGGNNIKDININTIRDNIVYISQKEYLYSDSIKNNILFHNKVTIEKFHHICNICMLEDVLSKKALRFDSFIEMDSSNFSGGEKQRIILARACMNNFKILIVDEALSEVDIKTEKEIIKNLKKYFNDKMIIYISHKNVKNLFKKVIEIV